MTETLSCKNQVVEGGRYWIEWFAGFESKRVSLPASADEFLPDLLRRARALKAETMYLNSFMVCR
jgi:hypothetical protein